MAEQDSLAVTMGAALRGGSYHISTVGAASGGSRRQRIDAHDTSSTASASTALIPFGPRAAHVCTDKIVSSTDIHKLIDIATAKGQRVVLLAEVEGVHAQLARSTIEHPSHRAEQEALHKLLPALGAVFGGVDRFMQIVARSREFSVATKNDRRRMRRQARVSTVQALSEHFKLAFVLAHAGSLQSDASYEMQRLLATHGVTFEHETLSVSRARVTVGADHVRGPRIPAARALRDFADQLHLDLGQSVSRLGATARLWPAEGTAQVRDMRPPVVDHLKWLFDQGALRDDLPRNITVHLKFTADFGHVGRFTICDRPFFADLVSLLADDEIFVAGTDTAVSEPLLWLLAAERDTLQPISALASLRVAALRSLEDVVLRDEDGDIQHVVSLQPLLDAGDMRWLQMSTGTSMGSSDFRDPMCTMPMSMIGCTSHALTAVSNPRTFLSNAIAHQNNDASLGYARLDVFLSGLPLPVAQPSYQLHMDDLRLWPLFRVFDGLHLVINHSGVIRSALLDTLPAATMKALNASLRAATGMSLERAAKAGWQWRLNWAQVEVFQQHLRRHARLLLLVQTFSRIIAALYAAAYLRNRKRLLQLAADCFAHARLYHMLDLPKRLAIHNIFSHLPFVYKDMAPSHALTESGESLFRPLRRIAIYASKHGDESVRSVLYRLLLFLSVRRWRKGLRQKRVLPVAMEPCPRCAEGLKGRTVLDVNLLGDLSPFHELLKRLGFDRTCFTRLPNGSLQMHDAHADRMPSGPALPTLSELSQRRINEHKQQSQQHFQRAAGVAVAGHAAHPPAPADVDAEAPLGLDDALPDEEYDRLFGSDAEQDYWEEREVAEAEREESLSDAEFKASPASARTLSQEPPAASECARAKLRSHRAAVCPICSGQKADQPAGAAMGLG